MNVISAGLPQCHHLSSSIVGSASSSPPPSHCNSSTHTAILPRIAFNNPSTSATRLASSFVRGRRVVRVSGDIANFGAERGRRTTVTCGLGDFWGGDLLGFDLGQWSKDVEDYGSIAVYAPHEGGYEGRYATRLREEGYHFMNMSARGMGDPESYLTKIHGVRPAHLGKQAIECFYLPPEVDYRLSALPEDSKGLVLWVHEAKVLSKTELQYLALLPALRKKVKVIAECGTWRSYRWKPLREASGLPLTESSEAIEPKTIETVGALPLTQSSEAVEAPTANVSGSQTEEKKPLVEAGL